MNPELFLGSVVGGGAGRVHGGLDRTTYGQEQDQERVLLAQHLLSLPCLQDFHRENYLIVGGYHDQISRCRRR
jgi:hypothetical protein